MQQLYEDVYSMEEKEPIPLRDEDKAKLSRFINGQNNTWVEQDETIRKVFSECRSRLTSRMSTWRRQVLPLRREGRVHKCDEQMNKAPTLTTRRILDAIKMWEPFGELMR